ncbi:PREDICTED: tumor susceptibility gene 101 protein [Ceratosolen solmsi marchali]|uniref:Tumor susceptibility gene 101 protein n=1 Tax=Ceratosolen solmsi marchali TaxID=326594 RepID=A0AAJ7DZX1_9HYME|nr:PREDICTED: tumor susceptibility gene 101 protein [Ceratosolen solmsi marchali]
MYYHLILSLIKIKQFLSKYHNPDITFNDIVGVIKVYPSLCWKIEPFVFNNGSRKLLIQLQGTIPVTFRCNIYHIPICIWVMDTHPNNAPMCYVTPTQEMKIKVSNFIDHTGKIYLPYLHDWIPHKSDLGSLIQVMILIFGEQPPVFKKRNTELVLSHEITSPYPKQSVSQLLPQREYMPHMLQNIYPSTDITYPNFPLSGSTSNYPIVGYTEPFPPYSSVSIYNYSISPALSGNSSSTGTITEEHIRASVLSAIGDKLRRRLREQFSQLQAELETLQRTQQELSGGSVRLTELFAKFQKEKIELEKNIRILQDKELELQKEINKLSNNQSIDIDEAVTTVAPLYKQMLNAFVEEAAIEDAIYYLAEGLRSSIIDLDAFLKQVRQLSRRQFMLRALMSLCRQKAGLTS